MERAVDRDDRPGQAAAPSMAPFIGAIAVSPDREVLLTWFNSEENNSITGYQVLRGPDADSLAVIEDDTGSTSTSYTDETPPAGQTHTYGVKARNASGLSPLSDTVEATVPAAEEEEELITASQTAADNTLVSNLGSPASGLSFSAQRTRRPAPLCADLRRRQQRGRNPGQVRLRRPHIRFLRISHREPRGKPLGRHRECRQQRRRQAVCSTS